MRYSFFNAKNCQLNYFLKSKNKWKVVMAHCCPSNNPAFIFLDGKNFFSMFPSLIIKKFRYFDYMPKLKGSISPSSFWLTHLVNVIRYLPFLRCVWGMKVYIVVRLQRAMEVSNYSIKRQLPVMKLIRPCHIFRVNDCVLGDGS